MTDFHALKVSSLTPETSDSVSITFDVSKELKETFRFKAGQYITIAHEIEGKSVRRAYSICSSQNSGSLKVGVKKVEGGTFSTYANEHLGVGDTLRVMAPKGKFTLPAEVNKNGSYAYFAAGSGITPILSLIKTVLETTEAKVVLAYGNRTIAESMFHAELVELLKEYGERIYIEFIFSRKQEGEARFGRIEKSTVNYLVKNKFENHKFDAYYLCGPEEMIDEVSATLKHNGINEKLIHHELFSTSEEGLLVKPHEGNTKITITVDDDVQTFEMPQTKSILQAALDEGLDPPYSCQGGICSTCIARIKEGKAEMRKNQILTDGEIAEGLILTCQAHPTTATVVVDYDDV